jgi:hypothetical protein
MLSFQQSLEFWKQPEVSWSQVRRVQQKLMAEVPFSAKEWHLK